MIQLFCIACALISVVLGWIVYANDRQSSANRYYALFTLTSSIWLFCNAFTIAGPISFSLDFRHFFASLISLTSVASLVLLIFFSHAFIGKRISSATRVFVVSQLVVLAATSFTSFNVVIQDGLIELGILYPLVVFFQVANVILLFSGLVGSRDEQVLEKRRRLFLRRSILISVLPIFILGSVFPLLGLNNISNVAPAFAIIFVVIFARAIIQRELFDIRETFARASAYIFSLATLVAVYIGLLLGLSQIFGETTTVDWRVRTFYLAIAIASALLFQPIKKFFDRVTNKIFFRDAYDPQQLIDEISNALVTHFELKELGDAVSIIIIKYLKVEFCSFYVSSSNRQHLFGTKKEMAFMKADDMTSRLAAKIVLIDDVHTGDSPEEKQLKREIVKTGARLVAKLETNTESVGAMFLGPKKSGGIISSADLRIIDILTDEIALAFQNASRFEEISTFNATLQQKIEAATQELIRTNQKLKALDEAKDEFISMASHQLRTPLTSVKGYLSIVLEGDVGEITEQQRALLSQAFFSSQRMVYLISDLLNVSRLRTGKFIIEPSEVNLANIVDEELKQVKETAKAKKVTLVYKKPKKFPIVQLDDTKIRQVMMNFIDNAIYYTPGGGKVTVELVARSKAVEFLVKDNGIGVPKSEQHHLFNKFYRAENARSMRPDGTGLGLFMAKKVIIASGGALIFKSAEGKGSTFGFHIPLE